MSGETKADWVHRAENLALFPRFELVDEFRRVSGGETLHIVSFSRLLEIFGATPETVKEVYREEIQLKTSLNRSSSPTVAAFATERRVLEWLRENYPYLTVEQESETDFEVTDGGATVGVEVKLFQHFSASRLIETVDHAKAILERDDSHLDSIFLFLIGSSALITSELQLALQRINRNLPVGVDAVVGRLLENGDLAIHDQFEILPKVR